LVLSPNRVVETKQSVPRTNTCVVYCFSRRLAVCLYLVRP
jgi:hypothetical protein